MPEEDKKPDENADKKPDEDKKAEPGKEGEGSGLKEKVNDIELAQIEKKRTELKELEVRVDKKTAQLKEIVAETASDGKGFSMGQKKEETPAEYKDKIMRGEV